MSSYPEVLNTPPALRNDYSKALFKAIGCRTVTKGSQVQVDDFGDVWLLLPATNRVGDLSVHRQYAGRIYLYPDTNVFINPGVIYITEVLPGYYIGLQHCMLTNTYPMLAPRLAELINTRALKVKLNYQKKPKQLTGAC